jgi:dTMP kinase
MAGLFITFEGVEGAGKTTQIELLRAALEDLGYSAYVTREPGGEPAAESIRRLLLNSELDITSTAELLLFLAARAQLTANVIVPRLAAGDIVICDRYVDSTTAYQGHARGHDIDVVGRLNRLATGGLMPDITILLDLDPAVGLARQTDRNRMEAEPVDFHRRVRQGFLEEARKDSRRFRVIDTAQTPQAVHEQILAAVKPLLPGRDE